mgnify:CR=1 FL=1
MAPLPKLPICYDCGETMEVVANGDQTLIALCPMCCTTYGVELDATNPTRIQFWPQFRLTTTEDPHHDESDPRKPAAVHPAAGRAI